jgi:hypothetical protein
MTEPDPALEAIIREYAAGLGITLVEFLGGGNDGDVWESDRRTAIKAFYRQSNFLSELSSYKRLRERGVTKILNLTVPRLVDWDEHMLVVEMEIVTPPCLIDFGKAYVDRAPDHSAETWQEYHEEQREIWGERYDDVEAVIWKLKQYGIFYRDSNPGNFRFDALGGVED